MNIKPINNSTDWNTFLLTQQPNTFLQSWEWGQAQEAAGSEPHYLGLFEDDQQIGAALVLTIPARRGPHLLIPHGPILTPETDTAEALSQLTSHLKNTAMTPAPAAIRIAPLIEATPQTQDIFTTAGFRPAPLHVHAELTWVLDITPSEDELLRGMRKTTRHAIRRAQAADIAVEIGSDPALLDRFLPLYEETRQRHAFKPYSRQTLEAQFKAFRPSNGIFTVIARYQNRDVAAAILFQFGGTVFYYHGASTKLPSSIPAAQLVQWSAITEARQRGAVRYNFWGIAPDDQPEHPFAGITTFKKGFGGRAIEYLHAQDLPLSWKYWQLWTVEMYRKLRRGF